MSVSLIAVAATLVGCGTVFAAGASAAYRNFRIYQGCASAIGDVGWQTGSHIGIDVSIGSMCGGNEFVKLSWSTPLRHTASIGSVTNGIRTYHQIFNAPTFWGVSLWGGIGAIKVALCNNWLGTTTCGPATSL
jgi:hypothetical protein